MQQVSIFCTIQYPEKSIFCTSAKRKFIYAQKITKNDPSMTENCFNCDNKIENLSKSE